MTLLDGFVFGFGLCCGTFAFAALVFAVALIVSAIADRRKGPGK